ncbi:DUF5908 family protein [Corallococcus aberystwythensis]|uniref:DUF5908 family protein n=1 Tax=Corallococcus aberystwythensis TaxID=2316722 RepID=UPI00131537A0|nr:DUF5908 family protein [Corallococcus aberystwythensis]
MPVEIRELVIKLTVRPQEPDAQRPSAQRREDEHDDVVAECVEQVMRILQAQRER